MIFLRSMYFEQQIDYNYLGIYTKLRYESQLFANVPLLRHWKIF